MELTLMIEGQEGVSWTDWVALAKTCETHGVAKLLRSDHYLNLDGVAERGSLDAWGTICALGAVTSTVRLGTLVSPATFRHPSELAKLVATADQVSGGRVELGLGAGWHDREHEAYGFEFGDLRTRMDVFEEQIQVVLGNWAGTAEQPFSFAGEHYQLHELNAEPKPIQQPHPPLVIGGSGGPRSLRLAARFADEYNVLYSTPEEAAELRTRLARACERAGRPMLRFSVMATTLVGADRAELSERITQAEQRLGLEPGSVADAPPGEWVIGTVDEAIAQLQALSDAGVDAVCCQHPLHDDLDAVALIGERLAPAVA